jgi:hypothetical protein
MQLRDDDDDVDNVRCVRVVREDEEEGKGEWVDVGGVEEVSDRKRVCVEGRDVLVLRVPGGLARSGSSTSNASSSSVQYCALDSVCYRTRPSSSARRTPRASQQRPLLTPLHSTHRLWRAVVRGRHRGHPRPAVHRVSLAQVRRSFLSHSHHVLTLDAWTREAGTTSTCTRARAS